MVFLGDDVERRTARLIEAHETERTRLARELHDDIGQRLALLTMDLDALRRLPLPPDEVSTRLDDLSDRTLQLARDIQAISQRLHPPKLDYLGMRSAAASFCREVSTRDNVDIAFRGDDVPDGVPARVALSVFRVLQEAVTNAVRHAGVRDVAVTLRGSPDELRLEVVDAGSGFDVDAALTGVGLGLVGMQERIRVVGGELAILSRPGAGTSLRARVPLSDPERSLPAA